MSTKNVHADLIHAWANGAKIQRFFPDTGLWVDIDDPLWVPSFQYRIKPSNQVRYGQVSYDRQIIHIVNENPLPRNQLKITFDGDSDKIIAVEIL